MCKAKTVESGSQVIACLERVLYDKLAGPDTDLASDGSIHIK